LSRKIIFSVLFLLLSFSAGFSKSYFVKSADVNINVLDNSLVGISEEVTFSFSGCYSVIYRDVPVPAESFVTGFEGFSDESFTPVVNDASDFYTYEFHFSQQQCDKDVTVLMIYNMSKVVDLYDDTSSFQFQFWGADWTNVNILSASINFPFTFNVSDYWVHNEVSGNSYSIDRNTFYYSAGNVPANHWVEVQVLFPRLSDSVFSDVHSGSYADEVKSQELYYQFLQVYNIILIVLFLTVPFILFYFMYNKYGKELIIDYSKTYERNPPDNMPPALVEAIINVTRDGMPDLKGFTATIFDLTRRKYLKITGDEKKVIIKILEKKWEADLKDFEVEVLDFLDKHAVNGGIDWDSLKHKLNRYDNAKDFWSRFNDFKKLVAKKFEKKDYFIDKGNNVFLIASVISLIVMVLLLLLSDLGNFALITPLLFFLPFFVFVKLLSKSGAAAYFILAFVGFQFLTFTAILTAFQLNPLSAFLVSVLIFLVLNTISPAILGKWTREGRLFELKWNNFKKFLNDYSLLNEYPPQSIIIWEQFLVYAVALGVADNVIKVMKLKVPDFNRTSNFGVLYYHPAFYSNLNSGFSAASTAASSRSGSGFGGGMGGFGGGHGGGGGGAR